MKREISIETTIENLRKNNFKVSFFENKEMAAEYLANLDYDGVIGFGDSETMVQMNLNELLSKKNKVIDPKKTSTDEEFIEVSRKCLLTDYFLHR